jgi:hypothetical protein
MSLDNEHCRACPSLARCLTMRGESVDTEAAPAPIVRRRTDRRSLGDWVLAYRYAYYVLGRSLVSDAEYDRLEAEARATLPAGHSVHGIGSDRRQDYPERVRALAVQLLGG